MDQQDTDSPIQCLIRRFNYHSSMSEALRPGSENQIYHEKMAEEFKNAIQYLRMMK